MKPIIVKIANKYKFHSFLDIDNLKEKIPHCSGVYIICIVKDNKRVIQYIGTTKNLNKRLNGHEVLKRIRKNLDASDLLEILLHKISTFRNYLENYLISIIRPPLNNTPKYGYRILQPL